MEGASEVLPAELGASADQSGQPDSAPAAANALRGHSVSPEAHTYLVLRNVAVLVTAALFGLSLFPVTAAWHLGMPLKSAAYFAGVAAYAFEYLMLTDGRKHKPPHQEMFMCNVFGVMYVILGISYFMH